MDTKDLGNLGEKLACEYLVKNGFNILGKNYTVPTSRQGISFGEIDIIAKKRWKLFSKKNKDIHFVEVKTTATNSDSFHPEDRVDHKKQRKLRQLCEIWLNKNKFKQNQPYQIDVIGILIDENSKSAKISYFENVVSG